MHFFYRHQTIQLLKRADLTWLQRRDFLPQIMGRHLDKIILLDNQAVARCLIGSWSGVPPPPALDKSRHNGRRHVDGTHLLNNHYFGSLLVAAGWVKVGGGG
jgi:hypothetical protein